MARGDQEGGRGVVVVDSVAQVGERLAEVLAGVALGLVRPEQAGEQLSRQGAL